MRPAPVDLWILTEERPKVEVVTWIVQRWLTDRSAACLVDFVRILPVCDTNGKFNFTYEVVGIRSPRLGRVLLRTIRGTGSMVDYMVFEGGEPPQEGAEPVLILEETKTSPAESRNTSVYQRLTKFVIAARTYPGVPCVMLYNRAGALTEANPPATFLFGIRLWKTLGIELRVVDSLADPLPGVQPFGSVAELIAARNKVSAKAGRGNVSNQIRLDDEAVTLAALLSKPNGGWHDPNVGQVSGITLALRKLGETRPVVVTQHGLTEGMVRESKLVSIARDLDISFSGLKPIQQLPATHVADAPYWQYDMKGEKLATIFLHIVIDNFSRGLTIFDNHAGCEKGYFLTPAGAALSVPKTTASGEKIAIPDVVWFDVDRSTVVIAEGKTSANVDQGIATLDTYDAFESVLVRENYPDLVIVTRTVVLFGQVVHRVEVGFVLDNNGDVHLGVAAPGLIEEAVHNYKFFYEI